MNDRTTFCLDCGQPLAIGPVGRPQGKCDDCTSEKVLKQRERRRREPRGNVRCVQCRVLIYHTRDLPGFETWCSDCGPGPGVTRRAKCSQCRRSFFRTHRGGKTLPNRKLLCDDCESTHKWCSTCEHVLPHEDFPFNRDKPDQMSSHCKVCGRQKYRDLGLEARQVRSLARFNLTLAQYEAMSLAQDDACAICRTPRAQCSRGYLAVDHDHACCDRDGSCGQCVRALLCTNCNIGIGMLGDDRLRLAAAIDYLIEHQGVRTPATA